MAPADMDGRVRMMAAAFLSEQTAFRGEVLPWSVLSAGFAVDGTRVPLIGPQGIFKPKILPDMPLTIATAPEVAGKPRPYDDGVVNDLLRYRYRGTDPMHHDNVGLRLAMQRRVPLIYLFGIVKGEYLPVWPVFIVADNPAELCFSVSFEERTVLAVGLLEAREDSAKRSYSTVSTLRRVHQAGFRQRVLHAYHDRCAICRLKHLELLEAAHILPDGHPRGEPVVPNGIALCKLHHAAFDRHILGVRPDLIVEVRRDILDEVDGPMLRYGLQEIAGTTLGVPSAERFKPRREFLEERYEMFRKVG